MSETAEIEHAQAGLSPPAATARTVRAHRRALEQRRDELKTSRAGLALASARGEPGASQALAALHRSIGDLEFEIECNGLAFDLANAQDGEAFAAWRAAVQRLEPEQLIEGIGKELCPARCLRGLAGGCVMLAGDVHAGSTCCHPILEKHLVYSRDGTGKRVFLFRHNPRALRIFEAACRKLKVTS